MRRLGIIIHSKVLKTHKCYILQPPPSVPSVAEHSPEATSAAGPEEEPPVYLSGAYGFLVVLFIFGIFNVRLKKQKK